MEMASVDDNYISIAPEIDDQVVGLRDKEEHVFYVLTLGRHTLTNSALSNGNDVLLATKNEDEDFSIEVSVKKRCRLYLVPLRGSCSVNGEHVPCGGNPVKMKLGGSLLIAGSKFVLTTKGPRGSPRTKKKERRLPSLPHETPIDASDDFSESDSMSSLGVDSSRRKLIQSINKDIRKLQRPISEPVQLRTPYSLVVANIITYQLLLQPRATIDNAVHKSLLNFLVLVEDVNQVMILEFIEVFREALHTPATPTFQLPTNPPTIEFMFNLLREATSNKDLLNHMVRACCVLSAVLVSFSHSVTNHRKMVECGVFPKFTNFMKYAELKNTCEFLLASWTILANVVHDSTYDTAMPLERVTLSVRLIKDQLTVFDEVREKIMIFIEALGSKARDCTKTHSESDLKIVKAYSISDATAILEQLSPLLSVLKSLLHQPASDAKSAMLFSKLVTILAPVSPVPKKPPRNRSRSQSPSKSPRVRRLPKLPVKTVCDDGLGVANTPSQDQTDDVRMSPLISKSAKISKSVSSFTGGEEGTTTRKDMVMLSNPSDVSSISVETTSSSDAITPTRRKVHSTSSNKIPPTRYEDPPTSNEDPPTSYEVPPTSNEDPPTSNEDPPTSSEVPPTSNKDPPTSDEVPPTSNKDPPTSNEVPPTSNEIQPAKRLSLGKKEGIPGVRDILAQQIKSLNVKELLGQEKTRFNLPSVRKDSRYYSTLTLKRSPSQQIQLQKMLASDDSSSSEEEQDSQVESTETRRDAESEPTMRLGGDGSESTGSLKCQTSKGAQFNKSLSMSSFEPGRAAWSPISSDELFAFKDKRNALLSGDQQALEEIQAGHMDVMCTLQGRYQLIPNVCRLWVDDNALKAVTNSMQMCLAEEDEDIALFMNVLSVFVEIKGSWRLSVCAVLLPILRKILSEQNDRRYIVPGCEVVEMMCDRFTDIITSCKKSSSSTRLSSTSDQQSKKMCYEELHVMLEVVRSKVNNPSLEQPVRDILHRLMSKLSPYVDPLS